jgi:hypothetical protein
VGSRYSLRVGLEPCGEPNVGPIIDCVPKLHPTLHALRTLVKKVRLQRADGLGAGYMNRRVPGGLARRDFRGMTLAADQVEAFHTALNTLVQDPRFEWLAPKKLDEELWWLACEARAKPDERRLADEFVEEYAHEPLTQTAFFPITGLETESQFDLFGIKLMPPTAVKMPDQLAVLSGLAKADPVGLVAAVEVSGTSDVRMAARGRETVEHALRLLRITLRSPLKFDDQSLRFKLGNIWWTEGGGHQWTMPGRPERSVRLQDDLVGMAVAQPVADLTASGGTKLDDHARIALGWFEKSQLEDDPLSKMLYLFFALEALLGEESEGLKGEKLALRRAILGHLTTGTFRHPARSYVLYDEVRSKAVHGSKLTEPVTDTEVVQFSADIRDAINEFLELGRDRGFAKRGQLRDALDNDAAHDELAARLYAENPKLWASLKPKEPDEAD